MTSAASAAKQLTLAKIALSSAEARTTIAELSPKAKSDAAALRGAKALGPGILGARFDQSDINDLNETAARLNVAAATIRANDETARIIGALGNKFQEPGGAGTPSSTGAAGAKKKSGGRKGRSGPSEADIEERFNQELASLAQQTLTARQQLATSAEERAELELRSVELARVAALESLQAEKNYSAAQKARIADAIENLAEIERERVEREKRVSIYEQARERADAEFQAQSDSLRQQYDLAKSQSARRDLAYKIIDLEYRHQEAALEALIAVETIAGVETERAKIAQMQLAALKQSRSGTMESARRDTAGPLERYFDNAKRDAAELNDLYEGIAVDGLQSLNDGLAEAIVNSKSLGDVFKNVAKQIIADLIRIAIQQVIVNSLMSAVGAGAGGGGGFGSILGSIFGRASGGYVAPGQTVRVNEQRGGAEFLRMGSQGGTVIPLGQVNQRAASNAPVIRVVSAPQFDLRGAVMTPKLYADMERIAQANAAEAGAAAYQRSMQDAPGAVAKAQRYGQ
jgi:hypothetical protein